ncbi:MAG: DegT/DnrJ/EryC1/StrS family aminotransferase [Fulvivirga sp.]
MKVPFLDIKKQHESIRHALDEAVAKVINSGWFIGGEYVERFENEFATYLGAKHCVTCGNGTDALELILEAYEIGAGSEVIMPSFTWVSDAEAVVRSGAKPVFADVAVDTFNLSADHIRPLITHKTKAIIVVHLFGLPCDLNPIKALCSEHGIKLIEDCAQAHGAVYQSQKVGTIGDAALFSFYPTKNLGALGDGGAVVTNSTDLADRIRLIKDHGQPVRDQHLLAGRNSRLDSLQAAVLSLKLKHLDAWNAERARLAADYLKELENTSLKLPLMQQGRVWHLFTVLSEHRDELKDHLAEADIQTAVHYPTPLHKMNAFKHELSLPNAEKLSSQILSLPLYPGLSEDNVRYIIGILQNLKV